MKINVGMGTDLTMSEVVLKIKEVVGYECELLFDTSNRMECIGDN